MVFRHEHPPPFGRAEARAPEARLAAHLGAALQEAGFTSRRVDALLGLTGWDQILHGDLAPVARRLAGDSPLLTLTKLFVAGLSLESKALRTALPETLLEALGHYGALSAQDNEVVSEILLQPLGELVLATDARRYASDPTYVMPVSATTQALAGLTIRHVVDDALDIGCGSGYQALLAASHARQVRAYDANPRAVAYTRFNAALNGIANVAADTGDLFDALPERAYDLIVANPPFVISPGSGHQFRDSGRPGDAVSQHLAHTLPRALRPGGIAQFLANWIVPRQSTGSDRLRGWLAGSGCDAWVLHERDELPDDYAARWLRDTDSGPLHVGHPEFLRWADYLNAEGVSALGSGLVTLRRRADGRESYLFEPAPADYAFPCSGAMRAQLLRYADPATQTPERLLRLCWGVAHDSVLEEWSEPAGDGWVCLARSLRSRGPLRWQHELDPLLAVVVKALSPTEPLEAILSQLAQALDIPEATLVDQVLPGLTSLIAHGLLVPGDAADSK